MTHLIQQLRAKMDIPLLEAKALIEKCGGDVDAAFEVALVGRIQPIMDKTGRPREVVVEAYFQNRQNVDRTIEHLRYSADPVEFENVSRPKTDELVDAINRARDSYEIFEACGVEEIRDFDEVVKRPAPIQSLTVLARFHSLYLGDTDALLRYHPEEYHDLIDRALRELGHADLADRYRLDVERIHQSSEHLNAFLAEEEEFLRNLRTFCLRNATGIHAWRMSQRGGF